MDTQITVKKRSFDLLHISEEEGAVLCTLTGRSDEEISDLLDLEFMEGETTLVDANRIAREMRDKIHKMVWGC